MLLKFAKFNEGYMHLPNEESYVVDASKLHWDKKDTFSVEVSELGKDFSTLLRGGFEIIVIKNPKTGKAVEYKKKIGASEKDAEGEVTHEIFYADNNSAGKGTKLIVWND